MPGTTIIVALRRRAAFIASYCNTATFENTDAINSEIGQRDAKILRLWEARWTAKEIANDLGIKVYTVGNVVRKHGRARRRSDHKKSDMTRLDSHPSKRA